MFEFDAGKLVIIGIVALIVIGPKELPRVLRQAGQAMAKLRRMAAEFQGQFMEAMREAELSDIQKESAKIAESAKIDVGFAPIVDLKSELTRAIDEPSLPSPASPAAIGDEAPSPPLLETSKNTVLDTKGSEPRDGDILAQPRLPAGPCDQAAGAHREFGGQTFEPPRPVSRT